MRTRIRQQLASWLPFPLAKHSARACASVRGTGNGKRGRFVRFNGHGLGVLALLFLAGVAAAAPQQDTTHAGELVYQRTCAMCHDHGEALRAPTLATLKGMRFISRSTLR